MPTGNDVLSEQALWEKAAKIKRVEHSPLGSELKRKSAIVKDQHAFYKYQMHVDESNRGTKIR